jgi:hypothetical protein
MREDIKKLLTEELPTTSYAVALKAYFEEELDKLHDFSDIKGDVVEKGRIVEGRQHAERIINRLLRIINLNKIQVPKEGTNSYK